MKDKDAQLYQEGFIAGEKKGRADTIKEIIEELDEDDRIFRRRLENKLKAQEKESTEKYKEHSLCVCPYWKVCMCRW